MVPYVLTTVLVKLLQSADGGCHVNKWPYSCEANFRIGPEKCEPCEPGRYGCNCSQICTPGTFGLNCYFTCNCSDEVCDPKVGCTSINETSVFTTARPYITDTPEATSKFHLFSPNSTPTFGTPEDPLSFLSTVIIILVTSLVLVVVISISCICFIIKRTSKTAFKEITGIKSGERSSGSGDENPDSHSYLTISDRSSRLYADVHYEEAMDRKSSPSESLNYKGSNSSSITESSKRSDDYLTPTGKVVDEKLSSGQLSGEDNVEHALVETCF
ncbi:uncharacterized protein LOC134228874 isoform X1 [Saccostrea cucullata]|uniref:uncharacterized protein LOC134228874 isoform X1 n=1 Tax=Saccostrea cuccullata TaxID=36930 RepID=UPI002ED149BE